jgi:hypothetical protein
MAIERNFNLDATFLRRLGLTEVEDGDVGRFVSEVIVDIKPISGLEVKRFWIDDDTVSWKQDKWFTGYKY